MKMKFMDQVRLCLFCIGLAACAGQMRTVPMHAYDSHPAQDVSPEDLKGSLGRIGTTRAAQ